MFCLSIWLNRLFQYFGIILGFVYSFVNTKKYEIKFYIIVKIYVYLINILSLYEAIYMVMQNLKYYDANEGLKLIPLIPKIAHILTILFYILLRIQEEQMYKKLFNILLTLQRKYFGKIIHISSDNITEIILILQICLIFSMMAHRLKEIIVQIWMGEWKYSMNLFILVVYKIMTHYILYQHGFILNYINNILLSLNNQLRLQEIAEPFAKVYINTSLILQQLNNIYSPILFGALLEIVMTQSTYMFGIFSILYQTPNLFDITFVIIQFGEYLNVTLYFLICERISKTIKDTDRIIMEYNTRKQNLEVCFLVFNVPKIGPYIYYTILV